MNDHTKNLPADSWAGWQTGSLDDAHDALRDGTTTSTQLTDEALKRIATYDDKLHSLLHVAQDSAGAAAKASDLRRASGTATGPLDGIPITIKDLISLRGMPLTAASKILANYSPPYTATVAQRLLDAGAVVVGKNNLDEFAMGSSNERSAFGATANPWALDRVPGGSSGGSGAAVAAGFGAGSLGTDTGGSVRLPAALCGVVGLKPTYGRVSRSGVVAFASSLDQVGPIARTVRGAARIFDVVAGPDALDSTCSATAMEATEPVLDKPLSGLRVGLPRPFFGGAVGVDPGVAAAIDQCVDALRQLGAVTVAVDLPHSKFSIATYYVVATAEAAANLQRYDGVRFGARAAIDAGESLDTMIARTRSEGFGPEVKRRIMLGTFVLASGYYEAYYDRACRVRRLIRDDYDRALQDVDVLVGPTSPVTAWPLGAHVDDPLAMYLMDVFTTGANLAGVPALSVPAGLVDGLPAGFQIIGRPFDEATILRVGHQVCAHLGTADLRPPMDWGRTP